MTFTVKIQTFGSFFGETTQNKLKEIGDWVSEQGIAPDDFTLEYGKTYKDETTGIRSRHLLFSFLNKQHAVLFKLTFG